MLINEAYRVLCDPENRKRYDRNPSSYQSSGFFVICRSCGYSSWVSDYVALKLKKCTACGRLFKSQLKKTGRELWNNIEPLLQYLVLSHNNLGEHQLASSLQIMCKKSPVTLDRMPDGKW